jgi:hypothetical protein
MVLNVAILDGVLRMKMVKGNIWERHMEGWRVACGRWMLCWVLLLRQQRKEFVNIVAVIFTNH